MGDPRKKVKRVKDKGFESWVSTVFSKPLLTECGCELNGPNAPTLEYNNIWFIG